MCKCVILSQMLAKLDFVPLVPKALYLIDYCTSKLKQAKLAPKVKRLLASWHSYDRSAFRLMRRVNPDRSLLRNDAKLLCKSKMMAIQIFLQVQLQIFDLHRSFARRFVLVRPTQVMHQGRALIDQGSALMHHRR